ncbi:MAG: hypothetical protein JNK58_01995 [Phycisphaerae bacterium]|nr:hypothetical protein [Phycisphaerae bacterium]
MMTSRTRNAALLVTGAGAAVMAYLLLHRPSTPEWLRDVSNPVWRFPEHTPKAMTAESSAVCRRVQNDLMLRPLWGEAEMVEIETIINRGYPRPLADPDQSVEERSKFFEYSSAFLALWNRMRNDAPMTPEAKAHGIRILRAEVYAEFPERRKDGGLALIETRLIENPDIRAEVERLLHDEDPVVAEVIGLQLGEYDRRSAVALKHKEFLKR